jgi:hypothetical protein
MYARDLVLFPSAEGNSCLAYASAQTVSEKAPMIVTGVWLLPDQHLHYLAR